MAYRYEGTRRQRLNALRATQPPAANAIELLEVDADQVTLRVSFLFPFAAVPAAPPTAREIRIVGGQPERVLRVTTVTPGSNTLVVTVEAPGDDATYSLSLIDGGDADRPPPGYDPILSRIDFSFKVHCPSDDDCAEPAPASAERAAAPPIDYLAKDYASFRRLLFDRLAVSLPDGVSQSPADLTTVLVELLAYAGDELSYYQDAVATEAYLGTARRRVSVRRHARLLDYHLDDGATARVWVHVATSAGEAMLPRGAQILTRVEEAPPAMMQGGEVHQAALQVGALVFETLHDARLRARHNEIHFWTWGAPEYRLPAGATEAALRDHAVPARRLDLAPGMLLLFQEEFGLPSGLAADADRDRRHVVRLVEVLNDVDPLSDQRVAIVRWSPDDALPFDMVISSLLPDGQPVENTLARGNLVLADFGMTVEADLEPPGAGPYRPLLPFENLTRQGHVSGSSAAPLLFDPAASAASALRWEPRDVVPAATLVENDVHQWLPRRDLLSSGRFAREFVVEGEDDGSVRLRFGDDGHGKAPTPGETLRFKGRVGNGRAGNVGADVLAHLALDPGTPLVLGGVPTVRADQVIATFNPLPAAGGADPERIERARQLAPYAFARQERAVTVDDYAAMAARHPEVQRAVATRCWTGSWSTMFLSVDRTGGLPVDAPFEERLRRFMERFRLAGHDIEIEGPRYVPLDIAMTICAAEGFLRSRVRTAVERALSSTVLPDGEKGFFHPDLWTFGQPVYLSRLTQAVMSVPGVAWIRFDEPRNRFQRLGRPTSTALAAGFIPIERLEIALLGRYPGLPPQGRLELFMEGGL